MELQHGNENEFSEILAIINPTLIYRKFFKRHS
jgi:hypothetical protein